MASFVANAKPLRKHTEPICFDIEHTKVPTIRNTLIGSTPIFAYCTQPYTLHKHMQQNHFVYCTHFQLTCIIVWTLSVHTDFEFALHCVLCVSLKFKHHFYRVERQLH